MKEYFVKEYIGSDQPTFEVVNDPEQKQNMVVNYIGRVVDSSWKDGLDNIETRDLFNNFRIEEFDSIPNREIQARMLGHFFYPEYTPTLKEILNGNGTFAQSLSPAEKSKLLDIASEPEGLQRVKSLANFVAPVSAEGDLGEPANFPKTEPSDDIPMLDTTQLEQLLRSPDILEEINSAIDQGDMAKFESLIERNEMFIKSSLTKAMENGYEIDQILIHLLGYPKYREFSIQTLRQLYLLGNKEVFPALQKAQADPQKREPAKDALRLISPAPFGEEVGNAEFFEESTPYDPVYYIKSKKTEPLPDDVPMLDTTQLDQLLRNPDSAPLTLNSLLQIGVHAMPALCVILTHKSGVK